MLIEEDDVPEGFLGGGFWPRILRSLELYNPKSASHAYSGFTDAPDDGLTNAQRHYRKYAASLEFKKKQQARHKKWLSDPANRQKVNQKRRERYAKAKAAALS